MTPHPPESDMGDGGSMLLLRCSCSRNAPLVARTLTCATPPSAGCRPQPKRGQQKGEEPRFLLSCHSVLQIAGAHSPAAPLRLMGLTHCRCCLAVAKAEVEVRDLHPSSQHVIIAAMQACTLLTAIV
jgi:hypothetical protein